MVVQRQIQFVKHKNLGFSDEQLLRVDMPNLQEKDSVEYKLLVDELIKKGCRVCVLDNLANGKLENIEAHRNENLFEFVKGLDSKFEEFIVICDISNLPGVEFHAG